MECRVPTESGKEFDHFPDWKSLEIIFWSVNMEKGNTFPDSIVWLHFYNILFNIDNFTFILLTVIVPVFYLRMWHLEKFKTGKSMETNFKIA